MKQPVKIFIWNKKQIIKNEKNIKTLYNSLITYTYNCELIILKEPEKKYNEIIPRKPKI